MDYFKIGQRIRKIRKARGISQEELAEKIGISTTHMSHIETGNTKLSLPVFVAISEALEVRTDDLLHDSVNADRSRSVDAILDLLENCSTQQIKVMEDILKAVKAAISTHL
ncbi:MAG: helix-turn-helix transcriptional regulator [Oscillospiraceae bacterium]|nr:helix-turn-helix transcriptional regulator [Oscillospiraceae bacterium]